MATTTVFKCRSAELKFRVPLVNRRSRGKMVPKRSLTNFGSTAGETSSVDSRNTPLQEKLSVKVFLESCNPYQTFCRPKLVWSIGTKCFVCHKYQDIALCVDVKECKLRRHQLYAVILVQVGTAESRERERKREREREREEGRERERERGKERERGREGERERGERERGKERERESTLHSSSSIDNRQSATLFTIKNGRSQCIKPQSKVAHFWTLTERFLKWNLQHWMFHSMVSV